MAKSVERDQVMAQVEIVTGPYRVLSLMSRGSPTSSARKPVSWPRQ